VASSGDKLIIETPEQTLLEFPLAGIGSRFVALALDTILQGATIFVLALVFVAAAAGNPLLSRSGSQWLIAGVLILFFLVNFGYFAFFETIWNGQTPGKRYARLRVMRDNGHPIGVYEALVRNLIRLIDELPGIYAVGIVSVLFSRQNKRLGDHVAGTVVVHERLLEGMKPVRQAPGQPAPFDVTRISPEEVQLLETFFFRRDNLDTVLRQHMASEIAERIGEKLGVPRHKRLDAEAFLEAIAEQRRNIGRYR
jgi:uncharacterized RDD family membrane protein YckC